VANRIALDSGALIKLSDGDPLTRALIRKWTEEKWETIVPAPVLAETLRGSRADARVHRILSSRSTAVTVVGVSEKAGRDAGERIGTARMTPRNTVDALIVACAVAERAKHIVTGDPGDIGALAGADLNIIAI
jgi:predicted nucleic acid-binding protein